MFFKWFADLFPLSQQHLRTLSAIFVLLMFLNDPLLNIATAEQKYTNRLINETSPYLLLHAHNPVDWFPWGAEAFAKAKTENKLVFLSIGYSSCHWCHVMEREVFADPKIASIMNQHFINIKVDREERPDIDDVYMTCLNVYYRATGSPQGGGWPLSLFLTPDGNPVAGGTYFPPKDRPGMMGFPRILNRLNQAWRDQEQQVLEQSEQLAGIVKRTLRQARPLQNIPISQTLVQQSIDHLLQEHDSTYGGFGFDPQNERRPKFPEPTNLMLLLHHYSRFKDEPSLKAAEKTLLAMSQGGIRDHLGGGFHRYSTDRYWKIPHFEKMLYDNAQLADAYVQAYSITRKDQYRHVAEEIFTFIERDMTQPGGGFFSALDADTEEEEGKYYIWTAEEIETFLTPKDAAHFKRFYGFHMGPNFESVANVLVTNESFLDVASELGTSEESLRQQIKQARAQLLKIRQQRPLPLLDDKILTAWNSLMIRALANAGRILNNTHYIEQAVQTADFLLTRLRNDQGQLLRTFRKDQAKIPAYLDDYAFLIESFLALHLATENNRWLSEAVRLTDQCLKDFSDEQQAGLYFTSKQHEQLLARTKDPFDGVLPSGNSVMAHNLIVLAKRTGNETYHERATKLIRSFTPFMQQAPGAMTNMAIAVDVLLKKAP